MLNEHQISAVNHREGPCLTLAGPGSGKTTVLVERISHLLDCGIEPQSILVITFTKDAAIEMKERFLVKSTKNGSLVTFGTFHSIFYNMLKSSSKYRDFDIADSRFRRKILNECLIFQKYKFSKKIIDELLKEISYFYNTGRSEIQSSILDEDVFLKLVENFDKRKKEYRCMDFDDMLILTKELFESDRKELVKWQKRFKYYLVDEVQDINEVQFDVLKLLCESNNIFAVGDDDQSIYGFRGSSPKFMLDFEKIFIGCKIIQLNINYRSCNKITEFSKRLIDNNKDRFYKDYKSFNDHKGSVCLKEFDNPYSQAAWICDYINKSDNRVAILFRNRQQSIVISSILRAKNINYYAKEIVTDINNHFVTKDIISYLSLSDEIDSGFINIDDLLSIMNRPDRDIKRAGLNSDRIDINKWLSFYPKHSENYCTIDRFLSSLKLMNSLNMYAKIMFIRNALGYDEFIRTNTNLTNEERELAKTICDNLSDLARNYKKTKDFIIDFTPSDENVIRELSENDRVFLYTFHASKGLEFDDVIIIDANEGITPSKNATSNELLEEERRMFYVAMTRAKSNLVICYNKTPSRFIGELGDGPFDML